MDEIAFPKILRILEVRLCLIYERDEIMRDMSISKPEQVSRLAKNYGLTFTTLNRLLHEAID